MRWNAGASEMFSKLRRQEERDMLGRKLEDVVQLTACECMNMDPTESNHSSREMPEINLQSTSAMSWMEKLTTLISRMRRGL